MHGYSDRIHHALAFTAKHYPEPVSRYDRHSGLIRASSVGLILARYGVEEPTIVAGILKQLVDAAPLERQHSLAQAIATRFGGEVAATVAAAAEPRFDVLGRERVWRACRLEILSRLYTAPPRAIDVSAADEMHRLGAALVAIRRLGIEYVDAAGVPHPEDTRWWLTSLLDGLHSHPAWRRPEMLRELRHLATELVERLREAGA